MTWLGADPSRIICPAAALIPGPVRSDQPAEVHGRQRRPHGDRRRRRPVSRQLLTATADGDVSTEGGGQGDPSRPQQTPADLATLGGPHSPPRDDVYLRRSPPIAASGRHRSASGTGERWMATLRAAPGSAPPPPPAARVNISVAAE